MTDKITSISKNSDNAMHFTPVGLLEDCIKDHQEDESFKSRKKLLIISLDDSNEGYHVSWWQSGMNMSQCVTLSEVAKTLFLSEMDYINRG